MRDSFLAAKKPANPWARISEIAARLGVPPRQDGDPPSVVAAGADGKQYDIWSVVAAALDRFDAAIAAEREACARVAEKFPPEVMQLYTRGPNDPPGNWSRPMTGRDIAAAIRARGTT